MELLAASAFTSNPYFIPFGDDIVGIDGFQGDGAAYAAFHITAERRAFSMETLLMMLGST